MSTLRAAIVGAGFMGERHFRTLSAFEDVVVVAIVDADEERRRALAERSGATGYRDYVAMLDREKPDAVWICVPPFVHPGPELAVLERGLPFFIEKPLSVDLKTAEEVARAVE